jgi:hypothetical protein
MEKMMTFFLPGQKSQKEMGTLNLDKSTGVARIDVLFIKGFDRRRSRIDLLFGEYEQDCHTFINSQVENIYMGIKGDRVRLTCQQFLTVHKNLDQNAQRFTRSVCHLDNLNRWFTPGDISHRLEAHPELTLDPKHTEILLSGAVGKKFKYQIVCQNYIMGIEDGVAINNSYRLELSFPKALVLSESIDIQKSFISAISIALYQQIRYSNLRVYAIRRDGKMYRSLNGYQYSTTRQPESEIDHLDRYYIPFEQLAPVFDQYINQWFSNRGLLEHIYLAALDSLDQNPRSPIDFRLINILSTLENLHRRLHDRVRMDSEEFERIKEQTIKSATNKPFRAILREKLAFSNSPGFRDRITELFGSMPEHIKDQLPETVFVQTFIRAICDTRNYLVHYDKSYENRKELFRSERLQHLFLKLRFVLIYNLLKDLGIAETLQEEAFDGFHFHQFKWDLEADPFRALLEKLYRTGKK